MNKKTILLTALVLVTAYQGYVVSDAMAIPGEFTTMWVIDMPRATYFIGESVTFTVVAFASTDPTLMLPDQMAKITIRNNSLAEVYEAWITTNVNGSAPVTWESGLDASAGNYTVILDDLKGEKVVEHFTLLYNEETFWQVKVDMIEKELQANYGYINYLFSYNKFLEKKVREMERRMTIFGALSFITVMCGIYVAMHEAAMTKRRGTGLMALPSKAFELVFRSKPIVELDHEVLEDVKVPREKRVPVYGHDKFCPICDVDKKNPMTETQLRDHLWAVHDRLHLKKGSIVAKWRARKAKSDAKTESKANEPIKPAFASVEKYQEEWEEETSREAFQARLNLIKKQLRKKQISDSEAKARISQLRADLDVVNKNPEVLKQTTSPKPEVQRKVRTAKTNLTIPSASTIETDEEPCPECAKLGAVELSEKGRARLERAVRMPTQRTKIDELFDELSREKVN